MSDEISVFPEASAVTALRRDAPGSKATRWFELALVLLISFSGYLVNSVQVLNHGAPSALTVRNLGWAYQLFHESIALLLLGYVLWRRKMRIRDLGLNWSGGDLLSGLFVAAAA